MSGYTMDDYRNAPSGIGPLADEWGDKPQRLIYDLVAAYRQVKATADELRVERDTLTAENAELRAKWERLTTALVKWKIDRRRIDWDDVVPADNWGIALREEGKQ